MSAVGVAADARDGEAGADMTASLHPSIFGSEQDRSLRRLPQSEVTRVAMQSRLQKTTG